MQGLAKNMCGVVACSLLAACNVVPPATVDMLPQPQTVSIRMPDGVNLSADIYRPSGGRHMRVPVLLEYLPYRKQESRARNHRLYSYFLKHGYAVARVDIRGTGNSEGRLIPWEYSDIELADGEQVIAWLARQEWSNGNVGMFGISWGGFNAIQLAGRQPPALKAIVALHATEDLYQEDVHYIDGILHVDSWLMSQEVDNSRPGAPDYVMDANYFEDRFDTEPWTLTYLKKQRDGPFWDRASMRDRHDELRVPGLFIGGWYDGYRDSIPRMLERNAAPAKAIVGAWTHAFPHEPWPNPGIEWRHEAVRFLDHWLKGLNNGYPQTPDLAVYVRTGHPPDPSLGYVPGSWRWEEGWPPRRARKEIWHAQPDHGLGRAPATGTRHSLEYRPASGIEAGGPVMWWGDVAPDQRPTDAQSLVYDSELLSEPLEILGLPRARLAVTADAPRANWFLRLSDVAPDGKVTLVTGAGFNGTHRQSARAPAPVPLDEQFPLDVELHFTSWVFKPGHRIRLSISNAQWPMFWPTPYRMTTTLAIGGEVGARLELPVIPDGPERRASFPPPAEVEDYDSYVTLDAGNASGYGEVSAIKTDPSTGEAVVTLENESATQFPWGIETWREYIEHRTSNDNPAHTSVYGRHSIEVQQPERLLRWEGELRLSSDATTLHYDYRRRVLENGELLRERHWQEDIRRDYQ